MQEVNDKPSIPGVLVGRREIRQMVAISDMSIWRWIRQGLFPRPMKIHGRNYWLKSELDAWVKAHAENRNTTGPMMAVNE